MIGVLLAILLLPGLAQAACTGSSPTWTTDVAALQSCLNGASRQDTINVVDSGVQTISSTISITKGVTLLGPGRDTLTILRSAGTLVDISPDATTISSSHNIKINGFTFDGNSNTNQIMTVGGAGQSGTKPWRYIIITNNRFKNTNQNSSYDAIYVQGFTYGVVANNLFDRVMIPLRCFADDTTPNLSWRNAAYQPFAYGSADNLYFEDNQIYWTATQGDSGGYSGWIECGHGGRIVGRYNSWNYTTVSGNGSELWDIHGFQNYPGGQDGTMLIEYYGNVITNFAGFRWVNQRGSWAMIFNNMMVSATGGSTMDLVQYDDGCNNDVNGSWPPPSGEVNNSYYWNNTRNGSQLDAASFGTAANINNQCAAVVNRAWFNQASASVNASPCTTSACTAGVGRGTTAPTGSCTSGTISSPADNAVSYGVGFWVAADADNSIATTTQTTDGKTMTVLTSAEKTNIQNSHLYKCVIGSWVDYYQPYTYPHPLSGTAVSVPRTHAGSGAARVTGGAHF